MLTDDPSDEIADPYGTDLRNYRVTATLLDDLLNQFVSLAFPR